MLTRKVLSVLILATGSVVAATAQNTVAIQSGVTTIALSPTLGASLQGYTVGAVSPSVLTSGVVSLPIAGGAFNLDTAKGEIFHTGGITFTKGNYVIALTDFLIDTTDDSEAGITAPVVSALVVANGVVSGRLPLFNLGRPSGFQLPIPLTDKYLFTLSNSAMTLNATAAAELNAAFGVTTLSGGLPIGTVNSVVIVGNPL